ncbi:MAG: ion transporter, partial [Chloroflexota bacterium]
MRAQSFSVSSELVMAVLAVLSIFLVVLDNVAIGPSEGPSFAHAVDLVICGVFAFDFFARLRGSDSRRVFVRENWYEPLAFVPAVAFSAVVGLPILSSALRALRLIRVVRVVFIVARMRLAFSSA